MNLPTLFFLFTVTVDLLDAQVFTKTCLSRLKPVSDSVALDRFRTPIRLYLVVNPVTPCGLKLDLTSVRRLGI